MLSCYMLRGYLSMGNEIRCDKPEAQGAWRRTALSGAQLGAYSCIVDARWRKECDDGGPNRRLGNDCKQAEPPVSLALKFLIANRVQRRRDIVPSYQSLAKASA